MTHYGYTFTEESILSFTPDPGWAAVFTDKDSGESWELPVLGWAVTCQWSAEAEAIRDNRDPAGPPHAIETRIEAVVLTEDAFAESLGGYLRATADPYLAEPGQHHRLPGYKIVRKPA